MAFRNYDNWYQDFEYDSAPSPSPPFTRSGSPFQTRSTRRRANSSPPHSSRPVIGEDGWEVLPAELLDPSNWGLPPSSLNNIPEEPAHGQDIVSTPGVTGRRLDTRRGQVVQFYPDYDPDLINTNQLDGMPYLLQPSTTINAFAKPIVFKSAAYNAAGPKKLSFSQRWEQGLLEMAHTHPQTLVNYSRIPPGKRGGFKSFGEFRGDDEGGQCGMGSSGGTVPRPNFGAFGNSRGRGQPSQPRTPSMPGHSSGVPGQLMSGGGGSSYTPGYSSGGPRQPLSWGGAQPLGGPSAGHGRGMRTIYETPRAVGGGYNSGASSSRQAAREAALRRDAATKTEQMRNKAGLKKEEYMKEIRKREKAAAAKAKKAKEEAEAEPIKQEKLERDRKARDRKQKDRVAKSKDVRSLAAEAAARRDAATKDLQHQRAESQRERRDREEREREERARARAQKKRDEEEEKYIVAQEKRERDIAMREAKAREVEVKSKDARELAREAAERRFKAMEKEKQAEERSKPAPKLATKATPAKPTAGLKSGSSKPAVSKTPAKPSPAPVKEATPAAKSAPAKTPTRPTPSKTTLPSRPVQHQPQLQLPNQRHPKRHQSQPHLHPRKRPKATKKNSQSANASD